MRVLKMECNNSVQEYLCFIGCSKENEWLCHDVGKIYVGD